MNKQLIASICILGLVGMVVGVAVLAGTEEPISATVTPKLVSVSVSPTTVNYGTLALSTSDGSRTTALSGTFTATNGGNVTETFNIKGTDATGGTTWTLDYSPANTGTVGNDQYVHRYDEGASFIGGEAAALSTSYLTLKAGVAALGTADFVLQMNMPTGTTGYGQRSSTVTVQAVAP